MKYATPEDELIRLRKEQVKTRQDEVFGGLSPAEQVAYEIKEERIHGLERELLERVYRSSRHAA